ncbi:GAF domain-containing protein [Actinocatenispora rupis]|nr:GAF domain-containing protein [Actinocatenispora rupis]
MSLFSSWLVRRYRVVAVSCAVGAFAFGSLAGRTKGPWFWVVLALAAVFTAASVGLPMFAERTASGRAADARQVAERSKQQMRLVVGRVLTPLAYLLGEISDARTRTGELDRLQGQALSVVLSAATELVDADGVRACFFRAIGGRLRRLELVGYYGRAEPGTIEFVAGTPLGDEAFRLMDEDRDGFYPDLLVDAPPGWVTDAHRHRSLAVVPVVTEREQFGILTIDAEECGALREQDVELVRLLGELLAAGLNR